MLTPESDYDPIAKILHWIIALGIIIVLITAAIIETPQGYLDPEFRRLTFVAHKSIGFLLLVASLLRLTWRSISPPPPLPAKSMPYWQFFAALFTHRALYVLAILTPLFGWAYVSTTHHTLSLFGMIDIPSLWFADPYMAHIDIVQSFFSIIHKTLAMLLTGLLIVHIGATILHHFIDRDNILLRISPKCWHPLLIKIRGK